MRVLIVDHSRGIRERLSIRLREAGLEVVAEAGNGAEAIAYVIAAALDAIVMDVLLPDRHGIDLLPNLREVAPRAVILILTNAPEYASHCLAQGADIVLDKSRDFDAVAGVLLGRARRA
jgi:DNA-binding NarL/FixJ family response regulator